MPRNETCPAPGSAGSIDEPRRSLSGPGLSFVAHMIETRSLTAEQFDGFAEDTLAFPHCRWIDSGTGDRWLGIGATDDIMARDAATAWTLPTLCRQRLRGIRAPAHVHPFLRYFGGVAFDPGDDPHPDWTAGGRSRFVLPRVLLHQAAGSDGTRGIVILPHEHGMGSKETQNRCAAELDATVRAIRSGDTAPDLPPLTGMPIEGGRARWFDSVRRALEAIDRGRIRKVVLSRDFLVSTPRRVSPEALMRRIAPFVSHGRLFSFRFDGETAFLGASPERLLSQTGPDILCDCLAGTGPRGVGGEGDEAAAAALLGSEKDSREHRFVRDGIVTSLEPVARWIELETRPSILRLAGLHHLSTSIRGSLREGIAIGDLLRRVHPTPAVGGSPREEALAMIRDLEGRSRGWYAGPVGWVGLDQADFAVGIRSGLVQGGCVRAFAGAGIVRGSDPQAEWDETARKAASFLNLFTEAVP
jgi:menaquinone-specific isochorismate synthase